MNIQHLRYALEVERTGSISQAADSLFMGQPNLSKAIKELESTLGIAIFRRTSKGVVPTEKGEEFLSYARSIIAQVDEMKNLYSRESASVQSFNISVPRCSAISTAFTHFINTLDADKGVEVNFRETNAMRAILNILEEDYTLGIIRFNTEHEPYFVNFLTDKEIAYEPLWSFSYRVLLSQDDPLAGQDAIAPADLTSYIEVAHGDLSVPYLPTGEVKKQEHPDHAKRRIYVYERGSQFDLLTRVPHTYMWTPPVPHEILDRYRLALRPCTTANHVYKDWFIHPRSHRLTALDKQFLQKLKAVWQVVADESFD